MNDFVLSEEDALLRSTEEQVGVLLGFYEDPFQVEQRQLDPEFVNRRRHSLEELQLALRATLAARDILPKQQDTEVSAWQFFVDRVRGLLRDEPLAVPLAEERKLLALCDSLADGGGIEPAAVRQGIADAQEAVAHLERPDER